MTINRPYDQTDDDVIVTERPNVYDVVSDMKRRELWVEQSRQTLDRAIEKARAGDTPGATAIIDNFVAGFNRRYGAVADADLHLPPELS